MYIIIFLNYEVRASFGHCPAGRKVKAATMHTTMMLETMVRLEDQPLKVNFVKQILYVIKVYL